jgi:hypothetical protein
MNTKQTVSTPKYFENKFPDNDACLEWLKNYRFPTGIECPICKKVTKYQKADALYYYKCDICGHSIDLTAGTIFHNSNIPLKAWFEAMLWLTTAGSKPSIKELQRRTGLTHKMAWRVLKQTREFVCEGNGMFMFAAITSDETRYTMKPIIEDIAKRLIPAASLRMGMTQKEILNKVAEHKVV